MQMQFLQWYCLQTVDTIERTLQSRVGPATPSMVEAWREKKPELASCLRRMGFSGGGGTTMVTHSCGGAGKGGEARGDSGEGAHHGDRSSARVQVTTGEGQLTKGKGAGEERA